MMIRLRWMFGSRIILDQHIAKGTKLGGGVVMKGEDRGKDLPCVFGYNRYDYEEFHRKT